jgi:hypothetical protein
MFRLSQSHHQVCLFTKMSHCVRCDALLGYTTKNLFVVDVKIQIYIIKMSGYYRILHLLHYINCEL